MERFLIQRAAILAALLIACAGCLSKEDKCASSDPQCAEVAPVAPVDPPPSSEVPVESTPEAAANPSLKKSQGAAAALLKDSVGNLYLIGTTDQSVHGANRYELDDIFVTKYDQALTWQWTKIYGSGYSDTLGSATMSSDGQLILVGETGGNFSTQLTTNGAQRGFVMSLDVDGLMNWVTYIGPNHGVMTDGSAESESGVGNNPLTYIRNVLIHQNTIYVAGMSSADLPDLDGSPLAGPNAADAFVAQISLSGNLEKIKSFGTATTEIPVKMNVQGNEIEVKAARSIGGSTGAYDFYRMNLDLSNLQSSLGAPDAAATARPPELNDRHFAEPDGSVMTATLDAQHVLILRKKDAAGQLLWERSTPLKKDGKGIYFNLTGLVVNSVGQAVVSFSKDFGATQPESGLSKENWILTMGSDGAESFVQW